MDYLTNQEINALIKEIRAGNNDAWGKICRNFENYIHDCCWKQLRKFDMSDAYRKELEEDLYMAGWQGFVTAIKNFESEKGKLLTYATYYISREISKELDILLNPLGLTQRPKQSYENNKAEIISRTTLDAFSGAAISAMNQKAGAFNMPDAPEREKYNAERRTLQILEILRILTDENHSLSKDELGRMLRLYRIAKYDNKTPLEAPNTFTSTLESILTELNPMEYSEQRESEYQIKYEGYKEDRLKKKLNKEKGRKAQDITGFSYVHTFNNAELDKLLQIICFSDMLSAEEKSQLIGKLMKTASAHYKTPFWDGDKIKFNPKAIHGRFSGRNEHEKENLSENLKIIQMAINNAGQIKFKFNRYTDNHTLLPKTDYIHILSPYHLVVYHDNYYLIGLKNDDKRIWHYRVELMSELEIVRDDEGKIIPIEVSAFEGLPITNTVWNPEKYMAEHLNMAWDDPKDIRIKIRNTDYTIIHDWFGEHYEKVDEIINIDDMGKEIQCDIVKVRTSPSMIVHWAMQYGSAVEIMDEEIREKIRIEMEMMAKNYENR